MSGIMHLPRLLLSNGRGPVSGYFLAREAVTVFMESGTTNHHIQVVCGRIVQSSGPPPYAIVDGMNVHDSRVGNYPPRWNAAPGQELLVIRRNHETGR